MVQGSYPRYQDEEKERLIAADEEKAGFEVVEVETPVSLSDDDNGDQPQKRCRWSRWRKRCCRKRDGSERKKRPVWRRILRFFMTIFLFSFLWHAFVKPWAVGVAWFGCNRHMDHYGYVPEVKIGETPFTKPNLHYDFPDATDTFFIKQERSNPRVPSRTNVFGAVKFVEADKHSVDFHVSVSDERLWDSINIEAKKDGIVFSADAFSLVEQFINITAVVGLSNSEDVKNLFVHTIELDVKLDENVKNALDKSRVSSVAGDITVYGTHNAGCARFNSVSGDVKGSFNLVKALGFKTVSGDIGVEVITVERDEKKAFLGTESVSGNLKVHVRQPLHARDLKSIHRTTSGDVYVRYPEEWQGKMKLRTTSGDFEVIGKNTKIIKKKKKFGKKAWSFIKGDGTSYGKIQTVSGDVKVSVGDT